VIEEERKTDTELPKQSNVFLGRVTQFEQDEDTLRQSEEKWRFLLENTADVILNLDRNGVILFINHTVPGYTVEDIIGKTIYDFIPPEQHNKTKNAIAKVFQTGEAVDFETSITRPDGSLLLYSTRLGPVKDGEKIIGVTQISTDITESKKLEEALQESEEQHKAIFEGAIDGIIYADRKGNIIEVNPAFTDITGIPREEVVGKNATSLAKKFAKHKNLPSLLRAINQMLRGVPIEPYELEINNKIIEISTPVSGAESTGITAIIRDITERRKAEETLRESEEKYRTLVESAAESIATVDKEGVFLFMSETGAKRLGGKPEDYVGKTMWDVFPRKIADRQAASVRKVINTGEGMNVVVLTELQGQPRWYNTTVEPLRDSSGKITAAMIVARDIQELRQAEEQVRKLSSAVEQSIDGIAIGDLELKLLYVNNTFARMHGYLPKDMIGMPIAKLLNGQQTDMYKRLLDKLKTQDFWEGEIGHIKKDGTAFPTYVSVTVLKNNEGQSTGTLAVARDITEYKRREKEFNLYREKMARAEQLASVGTLSATLAHELTQPLTVMRLSIENALANLETMSSAASVKKNIKDSLTEVSNITSIVERFRNHARRSTKTITGEVDLKTVAERTVQLLSESARQAGMTIRLEGIDELPPVYSSDKDLEQLFFALVENAVQAANGKKNRRLIIGGDVQDEHIELRFSDNCGGIAPENLERIFEPFFTTRPAGEGTGLGLCIVQQIVSRAGGKVRVESKAGKGSTFFVTLPIHKRKIS